MTYFSNDMVASLSQAVPDDDAGTTRTLENTYMLDAGERVSTIPPCGEGLRPDVRRECRHVPRTSQ